MRTMAPDQTDPNAACAPPSKCCDDHLSPGCEPWSEWWISPGGGRCRTIAMVSASNAISVCSVSRIDQPTIFAGMQIQYGGEVKPAFTGGDVGHENVDASVAD